MVLVSMRASSLKVRMFNLIISKINIYKILNLNGDLWAHRFTEYQRKDTFFLKKGGNFKLTILQIWSHFFCLLSDHSPIAFDERHPAPKGSCLLRPVSKKDCHCHLIGKAPSFLEHSAGHRGVALAAGPAWWSWSTAAAARRPPHWPWSARCAPSFCDPDAHHDGHWHQECPSHSLSGGRTTRATNVAICLLPFLKRMP